MSAEISVNDNDFQVGAVSELFLPDLRGTDERRLSLTSDGERLLAIGASADRASSPLHLVVNWTEEMKNRK